MVFFLFNSYLLLANYTVLIKYSSTNQQPNWIKVIRTPIYTLLVNNLKFSWITPNLQTYNWPFNLNLTQRMISLILKGRVLNKDLPYWLARDPSTLRRWLLKRPTWLRNWLQTLKSASNCYNVLSIVLHIIL